MTNILSDQGRILLVVENRENQLQLTEWMNHLGVQFSIVHNMNDAFETLLVESDSYALCLIDESEALNVFPIVNKVVHHKEVAQVPLMILKASPADKKRHIYQDLLKMVELKIKPLSFECFQQSVERYFDLYRMRTGLSSSYEDGAQLWSSASDGLLGLDVEGFIVFVNPAAARLLGGSPDQLVGLNVQGFLENPQPLVQSHWNEHPISVVCKRKEMLQIDSSRLWRIDGRPLPVKLVTMPISKIDGVEMMFAFKQKWQSRDDRTKPDLWVDQLTGVVTRNALEARVFDMFDGEDDLDQSMALFLMNLDHFRYVNEAVSHKVGDLVLRAVAERVERCIRDDDLIARIGGDEFAVLLHHVGSNVQVEPVMHKILQEFEEPFLLGGHEIYCTASIGVAISPRDGRTLSSLISVANAGINQLRGRADDDTAKDDLVGSIQRQSIQDRRNKLRRAISEHLWTVDFESVFSLHHDAPAFVNCVVTVDSGSGETTTLETLVSESVKLGMQNKLVDDLMQFMFAHASEQLDGSDLDLVVPLVGSYVRSNAPLLRWIEEYQWSNERLIIQMSERDLMRSRGEAHENLKYWTDNGVRLVVNDFGSGLGSVNLLEGLSIWALEMSEENLARPLMGHLIPSLAQALGAKLWVSGVGEPEALNRCLDQHIDFVQGSIIDDGNLADLK